ncbi:MAG: TetR/AcrR family transcriptional regulator [Ginsengibacter sp.]
MDKLKKEKSTGEKILAAAKKVFVTKGMAGGRMQDIADEAGINKALLHYYFRSKEKLFEVIFIEAAQKFFPKISFIFESDMSLFEKIEHICVAYITTMSENPYLPLFVLNEISRDPENFLDKIWNKQGFPKPQNFLNQIEKEVKKGTIKKISPLHLLINMISLCIFPFVGKAMIQSINSLDELQFRNIMNQRKKEVPKFIIDSIKK